MQSPMTDHEHQYVPILNGTVLWCTVDGCDSRKEVDESYLAVPIGTQYLSVNPIGPSKSGKTWMYEVLSESSGVRLGVIKWFGQWRQYCFWPETETIWNNACLSAVADVLKGLNDAR